MQQSLRLLSEVPPEPYNSIDLPDGIGEELQDPCNTQNDANVDCCIDKDFFPLHPVSSSTTHEFFYLLKSSVPLFFTFFIQYLIQVLIPTYFSSQLGPIYMSSSTLAMTTFYLTGPVLVNGFTSALDTLCSTAFGAKHYHKVGKYYIECMIILTVLLIPSMVFWYNSNSFFIYITRKNYPNDSQLSDLCTSVLSILVLAAPAVVIFECTKRFLQSQCKFSIPTRAAILGIPFSILFNFYFKNKLADSKPNLAPAISFVLTYWFMTIFLVSYTFFIDGYQCFPQFERKNCFKSFDIAIYFELGIPGILMVLSEAFAFQVLTFLSTTFPSSQLAAQSIVVVLVSLAFQPPFAAGISCSTHIANIIGARSSNYKPAIRAIYLIMVLLSIINFTWFYTLRAHLASLFTNDSEILDITSKLAKIIAINQFLDCFNIICAAVLRGQGRQKIGSILSLAAYYLIGIPLEFYFGFTRNLQIYGLWIGLAFAISFLSIFELIIVYRSDWIKIFKQNHKIA